MLVPKALCKVVLLIGFQNIGKITILRGKIGLDMFSLICSLHTVHIMVVHVSAMFGSLREDGLEWSLIEWNEIPQSRME